MKLNLRKIRSWEPRLGKGTYFGRYLKGRWLYTDSCLHSCIWYGDKLHAKKFIALFTLVHLLTWSHTSRNVAELVAMEKKVSMFCFTTDCYPTNHYQKRESTLPRKRAGGSNYYSTLQIGQILQ